jgi:hypothetical protein
MKNGTLGKKAGVAALAVLSVAGVGAALMTTRGGGQENVQGGVVIVEESYFCNVKALNVEERKKHTALTQKLLEKKRDVVETAKGYEFQYAPEDVSVAEVAEWVVAENKCCPFFDFHIDLEKKGRLVCLRLTGGTNIKAFIRSEFSLKDVPSTEQK